RDVSASHADKHGPGVQNKKWDEQGKAKLLSLVEQQAGRQLSDVERRHIVHGAEEHELVYSGLEDTMVMACQETRATAVSVREMRPPSVHLADEVSVFTNRNMEKKTDYRTAAFLNAISKVRLSVH
ncbi:MAG: hypothetical protein BJ554DRAFT_2823, partial [Olpidium bornovanus]